MSPDLNRTAAAAAHVAYALRRIEDAQRALDDAAEALCSVAGARSIWNRTGQLETLCRGLWHRIDHAHGRASWKLDRDPSPHDRKFYARAQVERCVLVDDARHYVIAASTERYVVFDWSNDVVSPGLEAHEHAIRAALDAVVRANSHGKRPPARLVLEVED